jgi:hypothetical protein
MEPATVDQTQRVANEALKLIEMGRVSEETKGLAHSGESFPLIRGNG